MLLTAAAIALFVGWVVALWPVYHLFGTDQTGNDVLFQAIKSIRTAVVIGSLATIATLPFAIVFGILAGYYKGWVDDAIQYLYTVLSSIPSVLLIAAFVLMIQVFIDKNPQMFETGVERADIRLFLLCADPRDHRLGGAGRLLRAETLKLSELDYVQAAHAFGVSHWRVMRAAHPAQRDAPRADRRGARLLGARALRGGAVVRRRRRRPELDELRHDDQQRAQRDVARSGRLVEPRDRVRVHGGARAVDAAVRRARCARRSIRARARSGRAAAPEGRPRRPKDAARDRQRQC